MAKMYYSSRVVMGRPSSKGCVTGRVCIIANLKERGKLKRGDVLVCKIAPDGSWNELISNAEGLVVQVGREISHGPMVARRLGIPCVSELKLKGDDDEFWRFIKDGDQIKVNGTAGFIEIIKNDE